MRFVLSSISASSRKQISQLPSQTLISSLTGLRAIAALIVAYSHFAGSGKTVGQFGVQLFFALSAFLMCLLYVDAPRGKTFGARLRFAVAFLQNRLARVVPMAVFVVFASLFLKEFPGCKRYNVYQITKPIWEYLTLRTASSIQWTIAVEVAFYIFFTTLLLLPYHAMLVTLRILTFSAVMAFVRPPPHGFESMTNIRWGLVTEKAYVYKWFMVGVLAYIVHRFISKKRSFVRGSTYLRFFLHTMASAVLVGYTALRLIWWHLLEKAANNWDSELDALHIALLILASLWIPPFRIFLEGSPLQHIGKVSYSLYLTHMFVFFRFAMHGWNRGSNLALFVAFVVVTTIISTFTYNFVERPATRAFRNPDARSTMPEWANPTSDKDFLPIYSAFVSAK